MQNSCVKQKEKIYRKTDFQGLGQFSKQCFFGKNLRALLDTRVMKSAQNCASFDSLGRQFQRIFFDSHKGGATFLEDKRSNKVERRSIFKKTFYILVLVFKAKPKSPEAT